MAPKWETRCCCGGILPDHHCPYGPLHSFGGAPPSDDGIRWGLNFTISNPLLSTCLPYSEASAQRCREHGRYCGIRGRGSVSVTIQPHVYQLLAHIGGNRTFYFLFPLKMRDVCVSESSLIHSVCICMQYACGKTRLTADHTLGLNNLPFSSSSPNPLGV